MVQLLYCTVIHYYIAVHRFIYCTHFNFILSDIFTCMHGMEVYDRQLLMTNHKEERAYMISLTQILLAFNR